MIAGVISAASGRDVGRGQVVVQCLGGPRQM
eukprot:gene14871-biopygen12674